MPRLIYHTQFSADVQEIVDWYNDRQWGLGNDFLHELRKSIAGIEQNPNSFCLVDDVIRVSQLRRFPYGVYFESIEQEQVIYFYAVVHLHRDDTSWQSREI